MLSDILGSGKFYIKLSDEQEHELSLIPLENSTLNIEAIPEPEFEPIVIPTPGSMEATFTLTNGEEFKKII